MNKNIILVKTLLLSTSSINTLKNCKDKKKSGKIKGNLIGQLILYIMLMTYCIANCAGYGYYGLTDSIPVLCATVISLLAFLFTFFKTNGYLFGFREYDMLMSLPFEAKDIAACKFSYMYIRNLPWYMSVSLSMMTGYGIFAKPSVIVYPLWMILSLFLPVIPMLAAAFLGFLIARIGSGFRNKNIVMTIITILFVLSIFGLRFFIEDMFRENKTEEVINSLSDKIDAVGKVYLPIEWFRSAITDLSIFNALLIVGISILLFEIIFIPVGRSYRKINSALKSHSSKGSFVMTQQNCKSILSTLVFKEFKRMTGSSVYMTNALLGEIFCLITGIAAIFVDIDKVISSMLRDAPVTKEMLYPAIPLIIYFFIGMVATTAFTPSLEGRNYWIIQSLPISKKVQYQSKMLFNMYLTVPFALFGTLMLCISAKAPLLNTILYIILVLCFCGFSSAWGCVCGVKHMRLDWENEIEVIKQGPAVAVYLLPNMLITIVLTVLVVYLGTIINANIVTALLILVVSALAFLSYHKVMSLSKE